MVQLKVRLAEAEARAERAEAQLEAQRETQREAVAKASAASRAELADALTHSTQQRSAGHPALELSESAQSPKWECLARLSPCPCRPSSSWPFGAV